ncbi:MAG: DegV family EDD domain-containing protein [Candidatus Heimdallarchaeota archaeon]|nr:DegV family EDD domain-containing protein [Candidatus Heimdallarchaeota archaeon]MCG3257885.1 DegV family EDD domain-containing protein [Candidatus Heimdallarchaeota archaeon]MCK4612936.1 DegV family EDD domain-containing protein [Candidatus Heimdallarchaeota archaeon]
MTGAIILANIAADIPSNLIEKYNIFTIQVPVEFPDTNEELIYPSEITYDEFLKRIHTSKKVPKPIQPSINYFVNTFKHLEEEGYEIIFIINMTSRGTGIVNTVRASIIQYQKQGGKSKFHQYDSKEGSFGVGILVIKAAEFLKEGKNFKAITSLLNDFKSNELKTTFTFESLKYLQRSGRIGLVKFVMGSLLSIYPCLEGTQDGVINSFNQAKSYEEAVEAIVTQAYISMKNFENLGCYIVSGNAEEGSTLAKQILTTRFPEVNFYGVIPMSGITYCFTGPGSVIVVMFKDFEH